MKRLQLKNNIGLLCLSLLLLWVSPLEAQTPTISSRAGTDKDPAYWGTASTWNPQRIPSASDIVSIGAHTIGLSGDREVRQLSMPNQNARINTNNGEAFGLILNGGNGVKFRIYGSGGKNDIRMDASFLATYTQPADMNLLAVVKVTALPGNERNAFSMQFELDPGSRPVTAFSADWNLYTSTNGTNWTLATKQSVTNNQNLIYSATQTLEKINGGKNPETPKDYYYAIAYPKQVTSSVLGNGCMTMTAAGKGLALTYLTTSAGKVTPEESNVPAPPAAPPVIPFSVQEGMQWRLQAPSAVNLTLTSSDLYNRINPQSVLVVKGTSGWSIIGTTTSNGTISVANYNVPNGNAIVALAQLHSSATTPKVYTYSQLGETVRVQTDGEWTTVANVDQKAYSSTSGEYIVTEDLGDRKAIVWRNRPIDLNRSFEMGFEVYFGTKDDTGADGISMIWQGMRDCNGLLRRDPLGWAPSGHTSGYGTGEFLGTLFIRPSLIFEFDTWNNWGMDLVEDHMAISKNGNMTNSGVTSPRSNILDLTSTLKAVALPNIEDGAWYLINMYWDWPDVDRTKASLRMDLLRKETPTESRRLVGSISRTFTAAELDAIFGFQYATSQSVYANATELANAEWTGTPTQKWVHSQWTNSGDRTLIVGFSASTGGSSNEQKFRELRVAYTPLRLDLDMNLNGLDYNTYLAPNTDISIVPSASRIQITNSQHKLTEMEVRIQPVTDGLDKESLRVNGTLPATLQSAYNPSTGILSITPINTTVSVPSDDFATALSMIVYRTTATFPKIDPHAVQIRLKGVVLTETDDYKPGDPVTSQASITYMRPMRLDLDGRDDEQQPHYTKVLTTTASNTRSEAALQSKVNLASGLTLDKLRINVSGLKSGDKLFNRNTLLTATNNVVEIDLPDATTAIADADKFKAFTDVLNALQVEMNNGDYQNRQLAVSLVAYSTNDPTKVTFESGVANANLYSAVIFLDGTNVHYSGTISAKDAETPISGTVRLAIPTTGTIQEVVLRLNGTTNIREYLQRESTAVANTKIQLSVAQGQEIRLTPIAGQSPLLADYQTVLQQMRYINKVDIPSLGNRTVDVSFTFFPSGSSGIAQSGGTATATLALGYAIPRIQHTATDGSIFYTFTRQVDMADPAMKTQLEGSNPVFSFWSTSEQSTMNVLDKIGTETSLKSVTLTYPAAQQGYLQQELINGIGSSYGGVALRVTVNGNSITVAYADGRDITQDAFRQMLNLKFSTAAIKSNAKAYMEQPRSLTITGLDVNGKVSNNFIYAFSVLNTSVLPLEISHWEAKQVGRKVSLRWKLHNTQLLASCAVERSVDGVTYHHLAMVPQQALAQYEFDDQLTSGTYYYRLRLQQQGGRILYSKPLQVQIVQQEAGLKVWPNPVKDGLLFYQYEGNAHAEVQVQLLDLQGKLLLSELLRLPASGVVSQALEVPASGLYLLRVFSEGKQAAVNKVLVQ